MAQQLCDKAVAPPGEVAEALGQRRGPVFLCLRVEGKKLWESWFEQPTQWAALQTGIEKMREKVPSSQLAAATTLELCLARSRRPVDPGNEASWNNLTANVSRGVIGVELTSGDKLERVSPTTTISTNSKVDELLQRFVSRHGIAPELAPHLVKVSVLACDQMLVLLSTNGETVPLVRGARFVSPSDVTAAHVRELIDLLGGFMVNNVRSAGRMTYAYYPSREEEDTSQNNMIRQWMASLALCRLASSRGDSSLSDLADRNIRYNLQHFYRCEGEFGIIDDAGAIKLGAVALAALTLAEHEKRAEYRAVEASLRRTMDQLWQPSGEFRTFWPLSGRNDMHDFYPGEALLTWASWYREEKDPELERRFMKSFRYYRAWHLNPKNRKPAFVPWHTQACALMWKATGNLELRDFIFEMNDWLVQLQQWPVPEHPDLAGRFYAPGKEYGPPHASSTGVYLEGLVDAYELALVYDDPVRAESYRLAIARGIRSVSQLVFRDEVDMFYATGRERLRGGVRTNPYDNVIRIDNVQHNLLALLKAVRAFHPLDFSCTPRDWPSDPSEFVSEDAPLRWVDSAVLEGANEFAGVTAVSARLTWQQGGALPAGFAQRIERLVPELRNRTNELLDDGAHPSGLSVGRLVASIAQSFQHRVHCLSELGTAVEGGDSGAILAVVVSEYPEVGQRALALATLLVAEAALPEADPSRLPLERYINAYKRFAKSFLPDAMRRAIARVARSRGIPWERVSRSVGIIRLGTGHWQKRCNLTTTSNTSMVHATMTANKPVSNPILYRMGVPVPRQLTATSADEAVRAAKTIGYPVVVKPSSGSGGYGVSANLVSDAQVREAFVRAIRLRGSKVAVEEFLPGEDYRLLFIGGEFVAACKRIPPHVIGDGQQTITELVYATNRLRDRGDGFWNTLHEYTIDEETVRVLAGFGLKPESIPVAGERVTLSSAANGGTTADTTAIMHPDNIAAAARAMRIAGIDVCGVDFLLPDPTRSYKQTGGGICEVNYDPSPMVHIIADGGCSLGVIDKFIDSLIPASRNGRIPLAVLFHAPQVLSSMVRRLVATRGVARYARDSVFIDDYEVTTAPPTWPDAARMALLDPGTEWAILEATSEGVLRHGLFAEWCDVAVLCDPRAVVERGHQVVLGLAGVTVLWARALGKVPSLDEKVAICCSRERGDVALREHCERGGRGVTLENGSFMLLNGATTFAIGSSSGLDEASVDAALLGAATAWGLGREPEAIAEALQRRVGGAAS